MSPARCQAPQLEHFKICCFHCLGAVPGSWIKCFPPIITLNFRYYLLEDRTSLYLPLNSPDQPAMTPTSFPPTIFTETHHDLRQAALVVCLLSSAQRGQARSVLLITMFHVGSLWKASEHLQQQRHRAVATFMPPFLAIVQDYPLSQTATIFIRSLGPTC